MIQGLDAASHSQARLRGVAVLRDHVGLEALHAAAPDRTRLLLVDADHVTILEDESGAIANDAMTWLDAAL